MNICERVEDYLWGVAAEIKQARTGQPVTVEKTVEEGVFDALGKKVADQPLTDLDATLLTLQRGTNLVINHNRPKRVVSRRLV